MSYTIVIHPYWEMDMLEHLSEVPVYQCTWYGKQKGRFGDLCAVTGLHLITFKETWWDSLHDCNASLHAFRKTGQKDIVVELPFA